MKFEIIDYDKFTMDDIAMTRENWNKVRERTDKEVLRVHWETLQFAEGYPDCLKGLPIEEQMEWYAVRESSEYSRGAYGEIEKSQITSGRYIPLKDYKRLSGVIVKDGVIIGAEIINYYHKTTQLYPGSSACIYWSVDSDGSGSSSSNEYVTMYCVSRKDA